MSKELKIMLGIAVVIIVLAAIFVFKGGGGQTSNTNSISSSQQQYLVRDTSHMTGSKNAKVTLVEFGDYQCPACAAASPVAQQLLSEYKNNPNFSFVFRNFPLPQHQFALLTAESAEAAGAQGKYWEMNDWLYAHQTEWENSSAPFDTISAYAQQLGLKMDQFKQDVSTNKYSGAIQQDLSDGNALGINATPTFYLNGVQQVGVPNFNTLKGQIDQELNK